MEKAKIMRIRFLVAIIFGLLLSGTALSGLAGETPEPDQFIFGEDTLVSITAVVGPRDRTGSGSGSGQDFETQAYNYKSPTVRDDLEAYINFLSDKEFKIERNFSIDEPGSGALVGPSATPDARLRVELEWTEDGYQISVTKQTNLEKMRIDYELLARGDELLDAEAYEEALAVFEEGIAAHPYVPIYYYKYGNALYYLGRLEESVESYNNALILDVQNWKCYNDRGVSYYFLGKYEEALADCLTAIRLGPDTADPYISLAYIQAAMGSLEDALSTCVLGLTEYPDNGNLLFALGETQLLLGNYSEALVAYDKMIEYGYCTADDLGESYAEAMGNAGESRQWLYSLEDGGATITGCVEKPSGHLVIPSDLEGYPVTGIGDKAFYACGGLTRVVIPDSVTRIGENAFSVCDSLISVDLSESLTTIGDSAFRNCDNLADIVLPISLVSIGDSAFRACGSLTGITIPGDVERIDANPFVGCYSLEFIDVATNNQTYTQINGVLFDKDKQTLVIYPAARKGEYSIPEGTVHIGGHAFEECNGLTGIIIPNSVASIGDTAFKQCGGLTSVTIPEGVAMIGNNAFRECLNLSEISISEGVTNIGNWAFNWCSFTSVTIPGSVVSVGDWAFSSCGNLKSVTISEGVASIGKKVFQMCSSLTNVAIPVSVTNIGVNPFQECPLMRISVSTDNQAYAQDDGVLFDAVQRMLISYPNARKGGYEIPEEVLGISESAFEGCVGLTSVQISTGVTEIGERAFAYCKIITDVLIPASVMDIGKDAFIGCWDLTLNVTEGSYAEQYAKENGIPYVLLEE